METVIHGCASSPWPLVWSRAPSGSLSAIDAKSSSSINSVDLASTLLFILLLDLASILCQLCVSMYWGCYLCVGLLAFELSWGLSVALVQGPGLLMCGVPRHLAASWVETWCLGLGRGKYVRQDQSGNGCPWTMRTLQRQGLAGCM